LHYSIWESMRLAGRLEFFVIFSGCFADVLHYSIYDSMVLAGMPESLAISYNRSFPALGCSMEVL
jgi:hypothetical protein